MAGSDPTAAADQLTGGATVPSQRSGPSDAELLDVIRGRGADAASTAAFGELYDRHHDAARALARQLARSPADVEDLVSAAFARLLEVLRSGGGPTEAFRAYLLTSLRHLAYDRTRADRRLDLTEDIDDVVGVDPERTVVPFADPAVAGLERSLAARAFATLPERWQAVLWHLEVEGDAPAAVAPLFGLTPNAVSALGYRAREGLRQAYLQEHLASESGAPPRDRRHRETSEKLGAFTRGGLSQRDVRRVEAHLAECEECRALAAELSEVNSGMVRSAVGPAVLGAALLGYLASRGAGGPDDLLAASALPTTGELAVAGGGVLGILGALGSVLRPATASPTSRGLVAAVGLAGVAGAVAVGVLGPPLGLGPGSSGDLGLPDGPGLPLAVPAPTVPDAGPAGAGGTGAGPGPDGGPGGGAPADAAGVAAVRAAAAAGSGEPGASDPGPATDSSGSAGRHAAGDSTRNTGSGSVRGAGCSCHAASGARHRRTVTTTVVTTTTTVVTTRTRPGGAAATDPALSGVLRSGVDGVRTGTAA